jgi:hypothetical protein
MRCLKLNRQGLNRSYRRRSGGSGDARGRRTRQDCKDVLIVLPPDGIRDGLLNVCGVPKDALVCQT